MNIRLVILALSLAANTYLGWAMMHNHAALPVHVSYGLPPEFPAMLDLPLRPRTNLMTSAPIAKDAPFHWSQLETIDFPEYILRLRAFGVPDRIVRNMIIAEVHQLYALRFAALRPPRASAGSRTNFWENRVAANDPSQGMAAWQLVRLSALEREQWMLIQTLVGQDIARRLFNDSSYPDLEGPRYNFLPKDKQDAVKQIDVVCTQAKANIYSQVDGYLDEDARADIAQLALKERHALAALLTPEQLEEFEVRNSDEADQMRRELGPLDPSELEFRAIFAYRQAQSAAPQPGDANTDPSSRAALAIEENIRKATDTLAETLGPERYQQYQLLSSTNFHSLIQDGVPVDTILEIVDLKNDTAEMAKSILADPSRTPEQRAQALNKLQADTQAALNDLLGERRARAYRNQDGGWIRDLTNRP